MQIERVFQQNLADNQREEDYCQAGLSEIPAADVSEQAARYLKF